jgi:8-oxo-dGTP pyrophosphatase MutT (NUDIX family)
MELTSQHIRKVLGEHQPRVTPWREGLKPAAVLAPFYRTPNGLSLIFTKRNENLNQHSGQISFPGGRREAVDPDDLSTALRETHEEIGVRPEDVEIWGRLNQEATVTRYSVAPYVGLVPYPYDFIIDPVEVERLIVVPLDHLTNPDHQDTEFYPWEGRQIKSYQFKFNQDVIWGATARMVHNLLTLLTTGREPEEPVI